MKASVTFREEKSPLVRMKFPMSLAGFPLASGIVFGDNEDLVLHLGTPPEICPSVKIAFQPNRPSSPFSLTLKAGIGPWGPPHAAALSVSADFRLSRAVSGPFFSVHVKPRLGDFSLRRMAKLASFGAVANTPYIKKEACVQSSRSQRQSHRQSHTSHHSSSEAPQQAIAADDKSDPGVFDDTEAAKKIMQGVSHGLYGDAPALTPLQLDKSSLFTPMTYQVPPFNRIRDGVSEEAESVDTWGNDYVKIEGFEHNNRMFHGDDSNLISRSHDDRRSGDGGHEFHPESPLSASVSGGSCINQRQTASMMKAVESSLVPWRFGVDESIQGWILQAHSSLPLGAQTTLNFRWGVNAHHDIFQGWDSRLSSFRLPYLYLQKISVISSGFAMHSCKQGKLSSADHLPTLSHYEDMYELSPVAALCGSMKRQLQLLYAENQVLRKAMEEMKAQFEQQSSGKSRRVSDNLGDMLVEETTASLTPEGKGSSKERKETSIKNCPDKSVSDKGKRNHGHDGLDALKKLGGLGRGVNGKS